MANVKLIFSGTRDLQEHELQVYANDLDEIFIEIEMGDFPPSWICLDKSTAIRLAKTLRTEINKIQ